MRDYGIVSPKFWIGSTGKALRGNADAQILALYLMTGPHATSTGVYHCPKLYMAHETGLSMEGACKALQSLIEAKFCEYDEASEWVFVCQMALFQVAEEVTPKDKRHKWLLREIENMPKPLKGKFISLYGQRFAIPTEPVPETEPEAPSKPLRSQDLDHGQDLEHGQDLDTDLSAAPTDVPRGTIPESDHVGQIVARVFSHWQETWGHPRAKLDAGRRRKIRDALKLGYSESDLCQAISGYRNSPHHMGRNDRHTVFDDLELLLRDAKHIDAGLKFYTEPPRRELSEKTLRIVDQTDGWVPPELRMNA